MCLASCAKDGDPSKKKSVSVGRFGVRQNSAASTPESAPAAETPPQTEKKTVAVAPADQLPAAADSAIVKPSGRKGEDDGIRLPNMLGMPEERELKSTNPAATGKPAGDGGGVISSPPVEKKE